MLTPRLCCWLLWGAFVLALPVPLVSPLAAQVPAARIFMLGMISIISMIGETTRGAVVPLAVLFLLQALVAMIVLWVGAYLLSRVLARCSPPVRTALTAAVIAALFMATILNQAYRDPYRSGTMHATLLEVYE